MSYFVVDVEADGEIPGKYSMVCFGVVKVSDPTKTFYGAVSPISTEHKPDALAVSGFSREDHEKFDPPQLVMNQFVQWLAENSDGKPTFISDNVAFDWQWLNYYLHTYCGKNPFGFSGRRIGDLYCGMVKDASKNQEWKIKLRITKHTHNPLDDAMGNVEALLAMQKMGLNIKF
jgi:DNA polymerase III epsilon subunit-like protein